MIEILHYKNGKEVEAIKAFLDWQEKPFKINEDISALKYTGGSGKPIIFINGEMVIGFVDLVVYFQLRGLLLL